MEESCCFTMSQFCSCRRRWLSKEKSALHSIARHLVRPCIKVLQGGRLWLSNINVESKLDLDCESLPAVLALMVGHDWIDGLDVLGLRLCRGLVVWVGG